MALSVFISVDMEGIAGISTLRQCTRGTDDYPWARELMTQEASAAVAGAADAGARRIVVSDSHADMGNLLPHELDPRAELIQGTPKLPWSMLAGIDGGGGPPWTAAVFVGYHAGAGTQAAVLDHTYSGAFSEVRVNGDVWNETHLNAALAGTFGVPVVFVSGDKACCDQAKERLPWVRTVAVKEGLGNRTGRSQSPSRAQAGIRGLVREAIKAVDHGAEVWTPEPPFALEVDVVNTNVADAIAVAPGSERRGPRTVGFDAADVPTAYRALLTWLALARHTAPVSPIV